MIKSVRKVRNMGESLYVQQLEFFKDHGMCVTPALIMSSEKYLRRHYREYGLEVDEMFEYAKWENTIKRYSETKLPLDQRIPYISHAIWVTNPD